MTENSQNLLLHKGNGSEQRQKLSESNFKTLEIKQSLAIIQDQEKKAEFL